MNKLFAKFIIVISFLFIISCDWPSGKENKVILTNDSQAKYLMYSCKDIRPQAESEEDIEIILNYLPSVIEELEQENKLVTLLSINAASLNKS